ncbi:autotransporter outer membrane beta-barrel domain-containing protein [Micavibrio aeruginosavorus]|uniref:Type I secretion target repeat protein n=1 Tax=Micavibrio aeruginosavorus EPB TaxID=349215 RepID=M4VCG1_9BACT|nr:hypothetical protein [Micavibrio aeruginosavorus]AGH96918.1 type I secretion target repeat protein [Micavibrio aeruginosavorus EPB]
MVSIRVSDISAAEAAQNDAHDPAANTAAADDSTITNAPSPDPTPDPSAADARPTIIPQPAEPEAQASPAAATQAHAPAQPAPNAPQSSGFGFQSQAQSVFSLSSDDPSLTPLDELDQPLGPIGASHLAHQAATVMAYTHETLTIAHPGHTSSHGGDTEPAIETRIINGTGSNEFFAGALYGLFYGGASIELEPDFDAYSIGNDATGYFFEPNGGGIKTYLADLDWSVIYQINAGAGNDLIFMYGDGSTIHAGDGDDIIGVFANTTTISAGDGNDNSMITGNNNSFATDNGTGAAEFNGNNNTITTGDEYYFLEISGDGNVVNGGTGELDIQFHGNSNTGTLYRAAGTSVEIYGDDNILTMSDAHSSDSLSIEMSGNGNTINTGATGDDDIEIWGNNNTINTGAGDGPDGDIITIHNDNNTLTIGNGYHSVTLEGNGNTVHSTGDDVNEYDISGANTTLYGSDDARDILTLSGNAINGVTTIYNFETDPGSDVLILQNDILETGDDLADILANLYFQANGADTDIYASPNSDGNFVHFATIIGGTNGLSLEDLINQGNINVPIAS